MFYDPVEKKIMRSRDIVISIDKMNRDIENIMVLIR